MKPSNPAKFFVNGNDEKSFAYAPGPTPYYAIGHSKHHVAICLIVFADSPEHVRAILKDMVDFAHDCANEYRNQKIDDRHDLGSQALHSALRLRDVLAERKGYKLEIGEVDRSQVHKVGWAGNDTL